MASFCYRLWQLYYTISQVLPLLYVKLCHTFRNICDTFVSISVQVYVQYNTLLVGNNHN